MRARVSASIAGPGASSSTFWWRRCKRAIALSQMHSAAIAIAKDLNFNMPRVAQVFFDIDLVIAESRLASARAVRNAVSISAALRASFMPRPPPPAVAFTITG
jgi:hypothetical protein